MRRTPLTALPLVLIAAPVLAAEGKAMNPIGFDLLQYGAAIAVFLVALIVLRITAWPKIAAGLEAREAKIRSEVFATEEARKKAEDLIKQHQRELTEAKASAERSIEQARAEQARLAADLKVKAEAELNAMRDEARRSIEAAKKAAVAEIYEHAAALSTAVAQQILQREVRPDDHRRFVDEIVGKVAKDLAASSAS
ncbi:MAG: hypothetical protein IBJ11_10880 [Phycisphaerales bacterium]|nr:hypothetical protein [Phycisphaerales bacterium]